MAAPEPDFRNDSRGVFSKHAHVGCFGDPAWSSGVYIPKPWVRCLYSESTGEVPLLT